MNGIFVVVPRTKSSFPVASLEEGHKLLEALVLRGHRDAWIRVPPITKTNRMKP